MPATIEKRVWTSRYLRSTIFRLIDQGIRNTEIITGLREVLKYDRVQKHLDKMLLFNAKTGLWTFRSKNVQKNVNRLFDLYTIENFKDAPQNRKFKKGDKFKVDDATGLLSFKHKIFTVARIARKENGNREIYAKEDSFPYNWFPPEHIVKVS